LSDTIGERKAKKKRFKKITIKITRIKFNLKINQNQMLMGEIKNKIQLKK
jgi:hypothetical protein